MRLSLLIFTLAVAFGALALAEGSWWWWPSLSFGIVAVAYALGRPGVFGKDRDGRLALLPQLILLPYLLVMWAAWHLMRLARRGEPYHLLEGDIVVGRRLLADEYPEHLASVVDLTCELTERLPAGRSLRYLNVPVLDGTAPSAATLLAAAKKARDLPRPLYVHCAYGNGRAVLFASALLRLEGHAPDATAALEHVCAVRPSANPSGMQRRTLKALEALLNE